MTINFNKTSNNRWLNKAYHTLDFEMKEIFNQKIVKLSLDGGFNCPNRDGTLGTEGCIFCSDVGSGDFAGNVPLTKAAPWDKVSLNPLNSLAAPGVLRLVTPIAQQITFQKHLLGDKWPNAGYVAYFQSFTNTYAPVSVLKNLYEQALQEPGVVGLAIATRPDALSPSVLDYLTELNSRTFLWVELGLQTTDDDRARFLNRGYTLSVFESAHAALKARGIRTVVHLIVGLPDPTHFQSENSSSGFSTTDSKAPLKTFDGRDFLTAMAKMNVYQPWGLKIHLLHVLKNTRLHQIYQEQPFPFPDCETYLQLLADGLELLNPDTVIHRVTGDAPKNLMVEPWWSLNKRAVLNGLDKVFKERGSWQGKYFKLT